MNDKEYHIDFMQRLKKSNEGVQRVAHWMMGRGLQVDVPATKYADKLENYNQYKDNGDLILHHKGKSHIIEVKTVRYRFFDNTNGKIWICNKKSFDRYDVKPYAYCIIHIREPKLLMIKTSTKDTWRIEEGYDPHRGYSYQVYATDIKNHNLYTIIGGGV